MLEITFKEPLRQVEPSRHITPGGAIFPLECLFLYDLEKRVIVLIEEYKVSRREGSDAFIFKTADPENGVRIGVHKRMIFSIRDLSNNQVIYPSTA